MSKTAHIQQSFDAGLLSPRLAARDDLAKYHNGCAVLENFLPTVQGPLVRRGGTQFISATKDNARAWLIPFQVSERIAYMLEFTPGTLRLYSERGVLIHSGVPIQLATPYAASDLTTPEGTCGISVTQSADVMYLFCRSHAPMKLMRTSSTTFALARAAFAHGPFDTINADPTLTISASAPAGPVTLTANATLFAPGQVGSLFYLESANLAAIKPWGVYQRVNEGDLRRVNRRVYVCTATGGNDGEGGPVTGNQTPVHTEGRAWDGDGKGIANDQRGPIGVEWAFLHPGYGMVRIDHYANPTEVSGTVVERLPDDVVIGAAAISVTAEHNATALTRESANTVRISAPGHSAQQGDWVVLSGTQIKIGNGSSIISIDGTHQATAVQDGSFLVGVATAPFTTVIAPGKVTITHSAHQVTGTPSHKWAHSLFSDAAGWPEHGIFWRNRLVLVRGVRLALSVAGDFENFADKIDGQVQADAGIVQTIAARQINRPAWLADAGDTLILGSNGDEWAIGPIQPNQPLGPENIRAERITAYGSRAIVPTRVGGKTLFVASSGRVLRDYEYSFDSDNYGSHDLTRLADHVLASGATAMAWQKEPDTILWIARADGVLAACTLHQDPGVSDVYAWSLHRLAGGHVEAVATLPAPDGDGADLWLTVRREVGGQIVRYVEILSRPLAEDAAQGEAFYVDCGLTYRGAPVRTITGLAHLEGQTIQILADGAVHPDRVVTGGTVALDWPVGLIHAGLPAPCRVATMAITAGSQNGTAQGKLKHITNVKVRLHRSLGGATGPAPETLQALDFRRARLPMGAPPALFTGEKTIVWPGGFETDPRIWYVNEQPLPVTLLAFLPMVAAHDDR